MIKDITYAEKVLNEQKEKLQKCINASQKSTTDVENKQQQTKNKNLTKIKKFYLKQV